jgi:6-phosphogluconolactonase
LAAAVAERLLEALVRVQADGREPQLCLTGGTVAHLVHLELAHRSPNSGVDWSRVVMWWGDERFVPRDSPDRNARQAREALLDHVPVSGERVHEMPSTSEFSEVEAAASSYAAELRAHGAGDFDVVLLGMGPDGHIASLFPGHPETEVDDRPAVGVTGSPKPPPERISLTLPALNRSREVWFLVTGAEKAAAVAAAAPAEESARNHGVLPAARVHGQERTIWFLDEAAAALLP